MNRNISGKVKKFIFERDRGKCVYCGSTENLEFDHIIPATKGGSNTERNIQLVCFVCNRLKYNYIDDDFLINQKERSLKLEKKRQRKKSKGKKTIPKYRYYDTNKVSQLPLPRAIMEGGNLNWEHQDEINVVFEVKNGNKGLFLFKKEKE